MSPEMAALWFRIEAHSLDAPAVTDPFSARLAREQRWSGGYTQRVIAEYKRFVLLAVTPSCGVTPSDAVDQVWHAHLTYTREYWDTFCGRVLRRPLHHAPGNGDAADHLKHVRNYGETLERYAAIFGEPPPSDIWPPVALRFGSQPSGVRVISRENLIVSWRSLRRAAVTGVVSGAGVLLLGALAQAHGLVVGGLCFAGQVGALLRAETLQARRLSEGATNATAVHAYEAIFLAGGADAVADAVIANLVARKGLSLDGTLVTQRSLFLAPHPLELAAHAEVSRQQGGMALGELQRFVATSTRDMSARLRGLGLTQSTSLGAPFLLAMMVPALLLVTAFARHQAVGWAVICGVPALILAASRYINPAGTSALGRAALASFKHDQEPLSHAYRPSQVVPGGHLPAIVALSGLEALRRFELGDLADALTLARLPAAPESCNTCGGGCGCG